MGCVHRADCPLFPHLNSSLQGWREYYCDHEENWRECARYQKSLTGARVPITLLPNGQQARYLAYGENGGTSGSGSGSGSGSTNSVRTQPDTQPSEHRTGPGQRRSEAEGGWWARLTDWMKGSA